MAVIPLSTSADVRAVEKLNKTLAKTDDQLEQIVKSGKGAAGAAERLARQADPLRRYEAQVAKVELAKRKLGLSTEHARVLTENYTRSLERAGRVSEQTIGSRAIQRVGAMASGYLSLGAAVGVVTTALSEQEAQAQKSADAIYASLDAFGMLQQLADSPEKMQQLSANANKFIYSGATTDRGLAYKTAFGLDSAGFSDDEVDRFVQLAADRLVPAAGTNEFAGKIKKIQDIFGVKEAGSIDELVDKVLAASKSAQSDAPTIAGEIAKFGGLAASLGYSDESAIAGFLASDKQSDTPAAASERMKSLFAQIKKRGLNQGTLDDTLDSIQKRVDAGEGVFDILGEQNAVIGFEDIMRRRDIYEEQKARMGDAAGTAERSAGLIDSVPEARAARAKARAEGKLQEALDSMGVGERENLVDAVMAETRAARVGRGQGAAATFRGMMERFSDWMGEDNLVLGNALQSGDLSQETAKATAEYLLRAGGQMPRGITEDYLRRIAEAVEQKPARQE